MSDSNERALMAPVTTPETEAFWNAAKEGRFVVPHCGGCGKSHWYPRAICPHCGSDDVSLTEASGKGTIYTYSVMRRAPVPYCIAYVTLEEGPSMLTNIVDGDLDSIHVGQAVTVVFKPTEEDGPPLPMFTPAG